MTSTYEYSIKSCAADRDMWEQQPGESDDRYTMFCFYKDMGPVRTHDLVAAHFGRSVATIRNYASAFLWRPRINAHDRNAAEQRGDQLQRDAVESNLRTIQALDKLEHFAYKGLMERDASDFTNMELIKLLDSIHTNKAKYIGMPTYQPQQPNGLMRGLPAVAADAETRSSDLNGLLAEFVRRNPRAVENGVQSTTEAPAEE